MNLKAGEYITVEELAMRSKKGRATMFRWMKAGKIKPTYIGSLLRFYVPEVRHLFVAQ